MSIEISVVVPVYMGKPFLVELCQRLIKSLETVSPNFEIILVDDRSSDNIWPMIAAESQKDNRVIGLHLSKNFGQHYALTAGLEHASGRWIVVMDCDLQDLPEDIPALYQKAKQDDLDIVIALRKNHLVHPWRKISSFAYNRCLRFLGDIESHEDVGNFRIFSRQVGDEFLKYRENFRVLPALMSLMGFNVGYVPVTRPDRAAGKSSYTILALIKLAIRAIIAHSEKPLWLGVYLGIASSIAALTMSIWTVWRKFYFGIDITGWSSIFIGITFFSGIQLLFGGILGIYIGRIYNETKHRPLYHVAKVSGLVRIKN